MKEGLVCCSCLLPEGNRGFHYICQSLLASSGQLFRDISQKRCVASCDSMCFSSVACQRNTSVSKRKITPEDYYL